MNQKIICYDEDLGIEAYSFTGVSQNFPNHFHDYYVVGLIEEGFRKMVVNNQAYTLEPGDLLTFNPMTIIVAKESMIADSLTIVSI